MKSETVVGSAERYPIVCRDGVPPQGKENRKRSIILAVLSALARAMDWPVEEFLSYLESSEGQKRYEACNVGAHDRGVFGVPTMMLGDEMSWGNDRLEFMSRYLANT